MNDGGFGSFVSCCQQLTLRAGGMSCAGIYFGGNVRRGNCPRKMFGRFMSSGESPTSARPALESGLLVNPNIGVVTAERGGREGHSLSKF